jgi:NAD(P)-dependent dehydrogenase (short-subunit alcohol dehydrogenase family)
VRLAEKVAIVTGAASGIGKRAAQVFAKEGALLAAVDVNARGLEETLQGMMAEGTTALAVPTDLTDAAQVEAMVRTTVERYGRIDVLCHCAGKDQPIVPIAEMDVALWDRIMAINARASFLVARYVVPVMIEAGGGAIVNIASDLGFVVVPGLGAYCSSKGAVLQLTRVLAAECGKYNIRVNALCPTMVDTPMARRTLDTHPDPAKWLSELEKGIPLGRIGNVDDVAEAAVFLASDQARYITGVALPVDGGRTLM